MTATTSDVLHANNQSGNRVGSVLSGLLIVGLLAVIAWWITKHVYGMTLPMNVPGKVLEYPIWASLVGLVGNVILKRLGIYDKIAPGIRTELFLQIGLILLGAGISFAVVVTAAAGAIIQAVVMITSVFFFCWWLGGVFGLNDRLRAVMSTAISVCGVSAAVAAAGSVLAKKEEVSYITTLVIVVALPLMVITPFVAAALGLPEDIAGAWFGGNIDTTAAVVGAGTIYGQQAQAIAAIVKSTQNAMIGVVAFLLALYFATVVEKDQGERPSWSQIWQRFPKFVLGFMLASLLFTFGVIDGSKGTAIDALKSWSFLLAFVCIGLELSFSELRRMGWAPVAVFLITTMFNTLLALGIAWLIFGVLMPMA